MAGVMAATFLVAYVAMPRARARSASAPSESPALS
jgi:hypothetical protein